MVDRGKQAWLYELRTRGFVEDLPAIDALVGQAASVLEVGCGTGRVLSYLARRRSDVAWIGVELDAAKVNVLRHKLEGEAISGIELWEGDFLNCPAFGPIDVVLFSFNVLAEFRGVEGRIAALRQARRLLAGQGRVVVICLTHDFAEWGVRQRLYTSRITDDDQGAWEVTFECTRDLMPQLSRCTVLYERDGESIRDAYEVALLTRNELLATYAAAGLALEQEFGDYQMGPLTETSAVWIHVLKSQLPADLLGGDG